MHMRHILTSRERVIRSMPMLDIGLAQLAMHSAVETAGVDDGCYMYRALKVFYDSAVCQTDDGRFIM